MFNPIYEFMAENSYGPTSAIISDVESYRFVLLQPYERYIVFLNSTIYLLVSGSECATPALKIVDGKASRVCLSFSRDYIRKMIMSNENRVKVVLDRSVTSHTIQELLNMCIAKGIFTL